MNLDPDLVRAKPRSVVLTWLDYDAADALYDDWQAEVADFEMNRALSDARPN